MASKHHRWLRQELDKWVYERLIDEAFAQHLKDRYPISDGGWGKIIFTAIGATLIGLGVILFFAYNWAEMPKFLKLAVVFLALALSHGGALWVRSRTPENHGLVEGLHILGTMMFGAGIWLVAQIYHIDEHYPNALLFWGLGALALAWAIPSLAQAFLAVVLVALWSGFEVVDFGETNHWAPWLVAIGILPLAWTQRSRVLLFFGLLALVIVMMLAVAALDDELIIPTAFYLCVAYVTFGLVVVDTQFSQSHRVFKSLGFAGYLTLLYVFSFPDGVELLGDVAFSHPLALTYIALVFAACVGSWLYVLVRLYATLDGFWRWQWGLLAIPVLLVTFGIANLLDFGWLIAVPMNLVFLAHCVFFIVQGCHESNAKLVAIACVLFSALVITRYVDLFESLLLRSVIFLLLGAGLFFVGTSYSRLKNQDEAAPR